jgi:hypothetical protein
VADLLGRKVRILHATTERVIDMPFNTIVEECLGALFVAADQYFATRRTQIVRFAAHHAIPTSIRGASSRRSVVSQAMEPMSLQ